MPRRLGQSPVAATGAIPSVVDWDNPQSRRLGQSPFVAGKPLVKVMAGLLREQNAEQVLLRTYTEMSMCKLLAHTILCCSGPDCSCKELPDEHYFQNTVRKCFPVTRKSSSTKSSLGSKEPALQRRSSLLPLQSSS